MNVTGGASGVPRAIREFTRAMCPETSTSRASIRIPANFNTGLVRHSGRRLTTVRQRRERRDLGAIAV